MNKIASMIGTGMMVIALGVGSSLAPQQQSTSKIFCLTWAEVVSSLRNRFLPLT
jgi:hypothetical protein